MYNYTPLCCSNALVADGSLRAGLIFQHPTARIRQTRFWNFVFVQLFSREKVPVTVKSASTMINRFCFITLYLAKGFVVYITRLETLMMGGGGAWPWRSTIVKVFYFFFLLQIQQKWGWKGYDRSAWKGYERSALDRFRRLDWSVQFKMC
jgi:hypothetical protein